MSAPREVHNEAPRPVVHKPLPPARGLQGPPRGDSPLAKDGYVPLPLRLAFAFLPVRARAVVARVCREWRAQAAAAVDWPPRLTWDLLRRWPPRQLARLRPAAIDLTANGFCFSANVLEFVRRTDSVRELRVPWAMLPTLLTGQVRLHSVTLVGHPCATPVFRSEPGGWTVIDPDVPAPSVGDCCEALAKLPALTALVFEAAVPQSVLEDVLRATLPRLQLRELALCSPGNEALPRDWHALGGTLAVLQLGTRELRALTPEVLAALAAGCPHLEALQVRLGSGATPAALEALAGCRALQRLDLSNRSGLWRTGATSSRCLAALARLTALRTLALSSDESGLTSQPLPWRRLASLTALEELCVSGWPGHGLRLTELAALPALRRLALPGSLSPDDTVARPGLLAQCARLELVQLQMLDAPTARALQALPALREIRLTDPPTLWSLQSQAALFAALRARGVRFGGPAVSKRPFVYF